jgi:hypothetical protein
MTTAQVVVRMDRSRDYSTIHGERPAGDRYANVHFFQDKMPFDSRGVLLPDHPDVLENEELKKKVERLLKNAAKAKIAAPGDADADSNGEEGEKIPVNLEAWARGESDWPWLEVTQAIARRYSRRVMNRRDALELLVSEKAVAAADLSPANKKLLEAD